MTHFIRGIVADITDTHVVLTLPDSQQLRWPISNDDQLSKKTIQKGDELTLTLTRTPDLINELLSSSEIPRKNDDNDPKN